MTLKKELDKHYQKLVKKNEREERMQKIRMKMEINRVLFLNKVKKVLFGI